MPWYPNPFSYIILLCKIPLNLKWEFHSHIFIYFKSKSCHFLTYRIFSVIVSPLCYLYHIHEMYIPPNTKFLLSVSFTSVYMYIYGECSTFVCLWKRSTLDHHCLYFSVNFVIDHLFIKGKSPYQIIINIYLFFMSLWWL